MLVGLSCTVNSQNLKRSRDSTHPFWGYYIIIARVVLCNCQLNSTQSPHRTQVWAPLCLRQNIGKLWIILLCKHLMNRSVTSSGQVGRKIIFNTLVQPKRQSVKSVSIRNLKCLASSILKIWFGGKFKKTGHVTLTTTTRGILSSQG